MIDNVVFAHKSLKKAEAHADDPFICFIVLWIGLNALYAAYGSANREADKLKLLLKDKKQVVYEVRSDHILELKDLFVFVSKEPQHRQLNKYMQTRRSVIDSNNIQVAVVYDLAEVLSKIRNNMFHAAKLWDEGKEAKLLEQVNPILRDLLKRLVESYQK